MSIISKTKEQDDIIKLYAVADGELIPMKDVNDITFARKMMGRGYAIRPANGIITSPVKGKVTQMFPTKHVIGFNSKKLDVLLHMGIDTVSLKGKPFNTKTFVGEKVDIELPISTVDLDMLERENKNNEMIVVFINGKKVIDNFEMYDLKVVKRGQEVGFIKLK